MKAKKILGLLIFCWLALPGCRKKKLYINQNIVEQQLVIRPVGIECEVCAKLACKKLMDIEGIRSATFVKDDQASYEDGSIIIIHAPAFSIDSINNALQEEGFDLKS